MWSQINVVAFLYTDENAVAVPHFRSPVYRYVSTFLDIRQIMGKAKNVNTLLYREVSTFLDIR